MRNSAARSHGGAVGAGWVSDEGFAGASLETLNNRYGVTVEPDVFIRLKRDRLATAAELRGMGGWLQQLSMQASHTRYEHEEVEGSGEVGTTFTSRGSELRLQVQHAPVGGVQGRFGLQSERLRFSASGEEAFVPDTHTRSDALFVLEELPLGAAVLSAGARAERVRVRSAGDAVDAVDDGEGRFGAATSRRFTPLSLSLAVRAALGAHWQASAWLGRTERAPAYYELYANGVHVATAAYERGDPALPLERSAHAELGLAWNDGPHAFKANLFDTRFGRYIVGPAKLDSTQAAWHPGWQRR